MRRMLTEDVGRWPAGHVFDHPKRWWETWFPGYEGFSVEADEFAQSAMKRPRGRPRKRSVSHGS